MNPIEAILLVLAILVLLSLLFFLLSKTIKGKVETGFSIFDKIQWFFKKEDAEKEIIKEGVMAENGNPFDIRVIMSGIADPKECS